MTEITEMTKEEIAKKRDEYMNNMQAMLGSLGGMSAMVEKLKPYLDEFTAQTQAIKFVYQKIKAIDDKLDRLLKMVDR